MDEIQKNDGVEPRRSPGKERRYRGGFFFPLLLVVVGVVLLLDNLNLLAGNASDILLRLWPVLLIIAGLDSLLKREGVAGSTFLIGLGVIFLLSNFDLITWSAWGLLLRLWPVFIIAIGLDIIVGRRSIFGAFIALVLTVAILVGALFLVGPGTPAAVHEINWAPEAATASGAISRISAEIKPMVGSLHLDSETGRAILAQGKLNLIKGEQVDEAYSVAGGVGKLSLRAQGATVFVPTLSGWGPGGWQLSLTPELPMDLVVGIGVGELILDLRALKIETLSVELGVGHIQVTLPEGSYQATIDSGIGLIDIFLPAGAAVRMVTDTGLSTVSVPPGFSENEHVYTSPGYDKAENRIELTVDNGIGSLVVQYK